MRCLSAVFLLMVAMFGSVLVADALSWPVTLPHILALVLLCTPLIYWFSLQDSRHAKKASTRGNSQPRLWRQIALASAALTGGLLALRTYRQPLFGFDQFFRWDFLAFQLLDRQSLRFYPPTSAADFQLYFYPDGMAPWISIWHWLFYALVGRHAPELLSLATLAEFTLLLVLLFQLAARLSNPRAGWLSVLCVSASPLFFRWFFIEQEAGWLMLAGVALVLAVVDNALFLAIAATAVGAWSREIGLLLLPIGILLAWLHRRPKRWLLIYALASLGLLAPWLGRVWLKTGNPFYDNPLGGLFASNAVHQRILHFGNGVRGFAALDWSGRMQLLGSLWLLAVVPLSAGCMGLFMHPKTRRALALPVCLFFLTWLGTLGFSAGGPWYHLRLAGPCFALLAVASGIALDHALDKRRYGRIISTVLAIACTVTLALNLAYPKKHFEQSVLVEAFSKRDFAPAEATVVPLLLDQLPAGSRILTADPYLHSLLYGSALTVVPVWGPDTQAQYFFTTPESITEAALLEMPFYREGLLHWPLVFRERGYALYAMQRP